MDADMVVPMQQAAEAAGVKLALNQMVKGFKTVEGTDGTVEVETSTGNRYQGELIILGLGVRPRIELAKSANIT